MSNAGNIITKNSKTIILYLFVVCILLIYIAHKKQNRATLNYQNFNNNSENTTEDKSMQDNNNTTEDAETFNKTDNEINNETDNDTEEERPKTGNLDFNQ
jgi:preprotein translocase subunit SecG